MSVTDQEHITAAEQAQAMLQQALRSPLPRIYANSFLNALTDADVLTIFQSNGQPVAILNMSYPVAKTLSAALAEAITEHEKKFNTSVPEIDFDSNKRPGKITVKP